MEPGILHVLVLALAAVPTVAQTVLGPPRPKGSVTGILATTISILVPNTMTTITTTTSWANDGLNPSRVSSRMYQFTGSATFSCQQGYQMMMIENVTPTCVICSSTDICNFPIQPQVPQKTGTTEQVASFASAPFISSTHGDNLIPSVIPATAVKTDVPKTVHTSLAVTDESEAPPSAQTSGHKPGQPSFPPTGIADPTTTNPLPSAQAESEPPGNGNSNSNGDNPNNPSDPDSTASPPIPNIPAVRITIISTNPTDGSAAPAGTAFVINAPGAPTASPSLVTLTPGVLTTINGIPVELHTYSNGAASVVYGGSGIAASTAAVGIETLPPPTTGTADAPAPSQALGAELSSLLRSGATALVTQMSSRRSGTQTAPASTSTNGAARCAAGGRIGAGVAAWSLPRWEDHIVVAGMAAAVSSLLVACGAMVW